MKSIGENTIKFMMVKHAKSGKRSWKALQRTGSRWQAAGSGSAGRVCEGWRVKVRRQVAQL